MDVCRIKNMETLEKWLMGKILWKVQSICCWDCSRLCGILRLSIYSQWSYHQMMVALNKSVNFSELVQRVILVHFGSCNMILFPENNNCTLELCPIIYHTYKITLNRNTTICLTMWWFEHSVQKLDFSASFLFCVVWINRFLHEKLLKCHLQYSSKLSLIIIRHHQVPLCKFKI